MAVSTDDDQTYESYHDTRHNKQGLGSICFWATTVMELSYSVPEDGEYFLK